MTDRIYHYESFRDRQDSQKASVHLDKR